MITVAYFSFFAAIGLAILWPTLKPALIFLSIAILAVAFKYLP